MNHVTRDLRALVADEALLDLALEGADVAPLLMVLVHLTGEEHWLDEVGPYIHGPWNFQESVPAELRQRLRARMKAVLLDVTARDAPLPSEPPAGLLRKMLSSGVGGQVPEEYIPMILEEMMLDDTDPKTVHWRTRPDDDTLSAFRVVIVGAGVSGLSMAIKLREAEIPFVIYEKNRTVGGTWLENSYPGCGVDTPNHFYSLSFEPNHDWPDHFSKRDELWSYMERLADKYDLRRDIRFETEVTAARYDDARAVWIVTTRDASGREETGDANAVITAVGQLNRPSIPPIPGIDEFLGPKFHTSRWDHSVDLSFANVAMIGTGASGMQVGPSIAPIVGHLTIFQRSAHWAVYNENYHRSVSPGKTAALKLIPFYAKWYRFQLLWASSDGLHASLHVDPDWSMPDQSLNETNQKFRDTITEYIREQVNGDENLMKKVVPPYPPYGKRMLRDNYWYRMLTQDNVDLVTDPIERITADGVLTKSGEFWPTDVLVLATGFEAQRMLAPMQIEGRGGQTIRDLWGDDNPRAYLGITVPAFPNLFMIYGPGTNLAHGGSAIYHSECQVRYIMQCLRELLETGARAMEVRRDPHDRFNEHLDATHAKMVWAHRGVGNWYKNKHGRVVTNSPFRLVDYREMTEKLDRNDYVME
ncbi:MAG: NAD(P)/FAD-dependent oxidoreductase [Acetobacteraceae bacterium]|jgi:4-hydroxyacetophenone monooxygenase